MSTFLEGWRTTYASGKVLGSPCCLTKSSFESVSLQNFWLLSTTTLLKTPKPILPMALRWAVGRAGRKSTVPPWRTPRGRLEMTFFAWQTVPAQVVIRTMAAEQSMVLTTWLQRIQLLLQQVWWTRLRKWLQPRVGRQSALSVSVFWLKQRADNWLSSAPLSLPSSSSLYATQFRMAAEQPAAAMDRNSSQHTCRLTSPQSVNFSRMNTTRLPQTALAVIMSAQLSSACCRKNALAGLAAVVARFSNFMQVSTELPILGLCTNEAPRSKGVPSKSVVLILPPSLSRASRMMWLIESEVRETEAPIPAAPAPMMMTGQTVYWLAPIPRVMVVRMRMTRLNM